MRNDDIRERLKVENITERCRKERLRWFGETNNTSEERFWRWYHLGEKKEEDRSREGWTVSTEIRESSERRKMKSMAELAGGELCLPQRPHNQVGGG